ncbi:MAG: ammonium transporter [Pseudomonadota bacterium]
MLLGLGLFIIAPSPALADVSSETRFIINALALLYHGMLVLFMSTGFSMLEAGSVRTKSVTTILLKKICLIALAALSYYVLGWALMFEGVNGGFIGTIDIWRPDDAAALAGDFSAGAPSIATWWFQMLFCVAAASIISGAMAEREKLWAFFAFVVIHSAVIYPIQGAWGWGGGWLDDIGFADFAGGAHVHATAGWAALTGLIVLGPRRGRFAADGTPRSMPASSLPLVTLGTLILWLGWLGFTGGTVQSFASAADAIKLATVYANTTMAACAGLLTAVVLSHIRTRKIDLLMVLNGALAGLVSITAGPETPGIGLAMAIGAVGCSLMFVTTSILLKCRIDDVVGAVPVHLSCGIWGVLAVPLSNDDTSIVTQLIGVGAISAFSLVTSLMTWLALQHTISLRLSQGEEAVGIDRAEAGALAYPEFETRSLAGDP